MQDDYSITQCNALCKVKVVPGPNKVNFVRASIRLMMTDDTHLKPHDYVTMAIELHQTDNNFAVWNITGRRFIVILDLPKT